MIESTAQDKSPDKVFVVFLRDGRTFAVTATTFARQINPDDEIKFFTSDGAEKEIFLRAPETAAVAPESSAVPPQPLVALQREVEGIKIRVDNIENNLGEIIIRAVAEAFSQRGL